MEGFSHFPVEVMLDKSYLRTIFHSGSRYLFYIKEQRISTQELFYYVIKMLCQHEIFYHQLEKSKN